MSELDAPVSARIERLHEEAEELVTRAAFVDARAARVLRERARNKIKRAAMLRARHEED